MKVSDLRTQAFLPAPATPHSWILKVYLPSLCGIVPNYMMLAIRAFLDFAYLVRRSAIDDVSLAEVDDALWRFKFYRTVFVDTGVRPNGFGLPRQHAIFHFPSHIRNFGAPVGLCTSAVESSHIRSVKRPYRRSNRNDPLHQILIINERLDKLRAARSSFNEQGMLAGSLLGALLGLDNAAGGLNLYSLFLNSLLIINNQREVNHPHQPQARDSNSGHVDATVSDQAADDHDGDEVVDEDEADGDSEPGEFEMEIVGEVVLAKKPRKLPPFLSPPAHVFTCLQRGHSQKPFWGSNSISILMRQIFLVWWSNSLGNNFPRAPSSIER